MTDEDGRDLLPLQFADQIQHMLDFADGQRGGGLVHDDELGIEGEGTGDGNRLLLPSGQFADRVAHRWHARAELADHGLRLLLDARAVDHADRHAEQALGGLSPQEDVGGDVLHSREGEVLIDHLDPALADLAWRMAADVGAVEVNRAAIRLVDAGDDLHQGRFAGTVVADQSHDFAGIDLEIDAEQDLDRPEMLLDAVEFEQAHRWPRARLTWSSQTASTSTAPIAIC